MAVAGAVGQAARRAATATPQFVPNPKIPVPVPQWGPLPLRGDALRPFRRAPQPRHPPPPGPSDVDAATGEALAPLPASRRLSPGAYARVPNVLVVRSVDYPYKFGWEICSALRALRIEFKDQTTVHPDTPAVRQLAWRCRHVVTLELVPLDDAKAALGVPPHVSFQQLRQALPSSSRARDAARSTYLTTVAKARRFRRMRMRDVLHRDAVERRLLAARKEAAAAVAAATKDAAGAGAAAAASG